MKRHDEQGFALVAAVAGTAVFALLCLEVLDVSRGTVALLRAQQDRAVLAAAADAGLAQAIYELGIEDRTRRLPVDGLPRISSFDGVRLTTTAVYEYSKIAINTASADVERRLFTAANVGGERLDILVDSLEDWKDPDNSARPHGAELPYYLPFGIRPRDDAIRTLGALGRVRGMDAALLVRLAPAITLLQGHGGFVADSAPPLALEAMRDPASASFDIQKRQQELAGERTALDIAADAPITGRPVSIHIEASLAGGVAYTLEETVEFTGDPQHPFWIRSVQ